MLSGEEVLRRLTIGDSGYCQQVMMLESDPLSQTLDARMTALVRLCGSITTGSSGPLLRQRVADAISTGIGFDKVVASLLTLGPSLGVDRLAAVAPDVARALGCDIDTVLELLA